MQAETALKFVLEKIHKGHNRIGEQGGRDRNLFLAYFEVKERLGKGGD